MLGVDAMRCGPGDPAIPLAREGLARAEEPPWSEVLQRALEDTASLAALVRPGAPEGSPWASTRPLNAVGYPCLETTPGKRCGQCAWLYDASDGGTPRCRHSEDALHPLGLSSDVDEPACNRFEPTMDEESCGLCGACCREAFHRVEVEPGERFARAHRSLLVADEHGLHLPRPGGRCPPLRGGGVEGPYRCGLYGDRPCSCADFEVAGAACLEARVRIGLGP